MRIRLSKVPFQPSYKKQLSYRKNVKQEIRKKTRKKKAKDQRAKKRIDGNKRNKVNR